MTENTTSEGGADAGSAIVAVDDPDLAGEHTDSSDEQTGTFSDEQTGTGDDAGADSVPATGAVSGGFGFAGLALAVVSLTTNWTSNVAVSYGQYAKEVSAKSSLTAQQQLDMYANGWQTQGWWALAFAAAAVLFGAGAVAVPWVRVSSGTPGWAKAAATSAIIVGAVGVLLAVLTIVGVFGGHLTAPASGG